MNFTRISHYFCTEPKDGVIITWLMRVDLLPKRVGDYFTPEEGGPEMHSLNPITVNLDSQVYIENIQKDSIIWHQIIDKYYPDDDVIFEEERKCWDNYY